MSEARKLDLYKEHKADYAAPQKPVLLQIAPAQYLAIEGQGRPGKEQFQVAKAALYGMAFTIKMTSKSSGLDYTVCKLEGIWWIDGDEQFEEARSEETHYKMMIRTPVFIKEKHRREAQEALASRGKTPRSADVRAGDVE